MRKVQQAEFCRISPGCPSQDTKQNREITHYEIERSQEFAWFKTCVLWKAQESPQCCNIEEMRDRMERFVVLPFSVGCISASSVAVAVQEHHPRRLKTETRAAEEDEEQETFSGESMKYSLKLLPLPKADDISTGFNKLFRTFKTLSQLFAYKEEMEEEEEEEDMEIGLPTDVKHVTHIGCDSSTSTATGNWENFGFSPEFSTHPPGQYDLSMSMVITHPDDLNLIKDSKSA